MSVFIFSRGAKNKVNLYFSLLTLFAFLWATTQLLAFLTINTNWLFFWDRSTYLFGVTILVCLLYFIIHFPYQSGNLSILEKVLVWIPAIGFALIIYTNFFISSFSIISSNRYTSQFYGAALILYMVYFVIIAIISLYRLGQKYKQSDLIFKNQIKYLLIVFILCLVFGFYIDLWLAYLGNNNFIWIAPLPTLIMNITVFYFIYSSRDEIHA